MNSNNSPCTNCERRELHCHSKCSDYKRFLIHRQIRRKRLMREHKLMEFHIDIKERMRKEQKRHQ